MPVDPNAPLTATQRACGRSLAYFHKTHKYLLKLEEEGWKCCRAYCLRDVDKRAIVARSALWGAKEVGQRRRDLLALIAWCKVWAQGGDAHYVLRVFGKPVCARAFANAHGEHQRSFFRRKSQLQNAIGDHVPQRVAHRRPGGRPGCRRDDCAAWLRDTLSRMSQPLPHKTVKGSNGEERTREFLPSGLFTTLQDVYDYYCGHVLSDVDAPLDSTHPVERRPASFQTFRRAWLSNFFQVCSRHRHTLCWVVYLSHTAVWCLDSINVSQLCVMCEKRCCLLLCNALGAVTASMCPGAPSPANMEQSRSMSGTAVRVRDRARVPEMHLVKSILSRAACNPGPADVDFQPDRARTAGLHRHVWRCAARARDVTAERVRDRARVRAMYLDENILSCTICSHRRADVLFQPDRARPAGFHRHV